MSCLNIVVSKIIVVDFPAVAVTAIQAGGLPVVHAASYGWTALMTYCDPWLISLMAQTWFA
jgi:hypothetical protein